MQHTNSIIAGKLIQFRPADTSGVKHNYSVFDDDSFHLDFLHFVATTRDMVCPVGTQLRIADTKDPGTKR